MTSFAYPEESTSVFEFKSTTTKLTAFVPCTLEPEKLILALQQQLGDGEHFLSDEQIAIDFSLLKSIPSAIEILALVNLLRQFQLNPIVAQGGNFDQQVAVNCKNTVVKYLTCDYVHLGEQVVPYLSYNYRYYQLNYNIRLSSSWYT